MRYFFRSSVRPIQKQNEEPKYKKRLAKLKTDTFLSHTHLSHHAINFTNNPFNVQEGTVHIYNEIRLNTKFQAYHVYDIPLKMTHFK